MRGATDQQHDRKMEDQRRASIFTLLGTKVPSVRLVSHGEARDGHTGTTTITGRNRSVILAAASIRLWPTS
jgi:hypothetical protein